MKELLKKYEEKDPEIVFHWRDYQTEAEGWTVINSLRGGAAGGGTDGGNDGGGTLGGGADGGRSGGE